MPKYKVGNLSSDEFMNSTGCAQCGEPVDKSRQYCQEHRVDETSEKSGDLDTK